MQNFMFVGVLVIEILEFNGMKRKHRRIWHRSIKEYGKTVKYHITSITPVLQDFADLFSISLVSNMFFTSMLVEVKLKFIFVQLNDHSNPYIESNIFSHVTYHRSLTQTLLCHLQQ